jgi:hypothetical protein
MASTHTVDGDWYTSGDAGLTWTPFANPGPNNANNIGFLNSTIVIATGPLGVYRLTKSGGVWSGAQTLVNEGPHGGQQHFRDDVYQFYYIGGTTDLASSKIWRSSFSDGGQTWTLVSTSLGSTYGACTLWGSATKIYAQANFATHGEYYHFAQIATRANGTDWTLMPNLPAGYKMGAHSAISMTDGSRSVSYAALDNWGLWRRIEP